MTGDEREEEGRLLLEALAEVQAAIDRDRAIDAAGVLLKANREAGYVDEE